MYGLTEAEYRALPVQTRITLAATELHGWRHPWRHNTHVRFPSQRGSIPPALVDPDHRYIDCSSTSAFVLMTAFPEAPWDAEAYGDLQVFEDRLPDRPESATEAIERMGIGSRIETVQAMRDADPGFPVRTCWPVVDILGWRVKGDDPRAFRGHNMLALVLPGGLLVFESSSLHHVDGPRWYWTTEENLRKRYHAGISIAVLGEG